MHLGIASDRRGSTGIIRVGILVITVLFLLYIFAIVAPAVIEPLHEYAVNDQDVQDQGYVGTLDHYLQMSLEYAPAALLVGIFGLLFAYAVFRESFSGPRRRP